MHWGYLSSRIWGAAYERWGFYEYLNATSFATTIPTESATIRLCGIIIGQDLDLVRIASHNAQPVAIPRNV
jgi:hypothetical protein